MFKEAFCLLQSIKAGTVSFPPKLNKCKIEHAPPRRYFSVKLQKESRPLDDDAFSTFSFCVFRIFVNFYVF